MGRELTPSPPITVLICDDNAAMREVLHDVVASADGMCVIGEAADGEIAIEEAARLQPTVILLDLAMPVLSGLEALPRIRESTAAAKIVVFSGFASKVMEERVLALGADHYLEKGSDMATIIATIEQVVAHRTASV